jgi:polyhydroxyalkanoate synthesis regulator phasin
MFIDVSSELYWKMLHDLANMKSEEIFGKASEERIDQLSKQIRDLDTASKWKF